MQTSSLQPTGRPRGESNANPEPDRPRSASFNTAPSAFADICRVHADRFNLIRPRSQSTVDLARSLVSQARCGTWQQVHQLLSLGVSVYSREGHEQSDYALRVAASNPGRAVVTRLLVEHGAGEAVPVMVKYALNNESLARAADCEAVLALTHGGYADVNARDANGCTPFMHQAVAGRLPVVRLMMTLGARTDIKDDQGRTALQLATNDQVKQIISGPRQPDVGYLKIHLIDAQKAFDRPLFNFTQESAVITFTCGSSQVKSPPAEKRDDVVWNCNLQLPVVDSWQLSVRVGENREEVKDIDLLDVVCGSHRREVALSFSKAASGNLRFNLTFEFA